jgi:hypothetical protein
MAAKARASPRAFMSNADSLSKFGLGLYLTSVRSSCASDAHNRVRDEDAILRGGAGAAAGGTPPPDYLPGLEDDLPSRSGAAPEDRVLVADHLLGLRDGREGPRQPESLHVSAR